ncbi:MAG: acyl-CoA dehydrogenase family protein [Xanthomonadaceae bacterium]|jgi:alkylation response protein AidB-like acyl-CoA dehydrogenase|nr:acyl-CoA dehydrogenase family protein [Xanthomonadaceae bacterium]
MGFTQQGPLLDNQYLEDRLLRSLLRRVLPPATLAAIEPGLTEFGELVADWYPAQVAAHAEQPVHVPFDAWGNRVDRVELGAFWREAPAIAARHGLVAAGYERDHGPHARLHQFALAYLFTASSEIYSCPLAMTDGAARCLLDAGNKVLIERAVPHLTSRDPAQFWISGQWMTETTGGSDVAGTETIARPDENGRWRLHGRKWFTSAVVCDMALTLARPEGSGPGGDHLALFYVEPRRPDGRYRNLTIDRLKPKLGTRKLPTAEITLDGTPAHLVGEARHGVRRIAPMLNITRLWNAVAAVSLFRRGLALARSYATRRVVFGMPLLDHGLHQETLADLQAELEAGFHLTFFIAELLGRSEHGHIDDAHAQLLRLMTPAAKLMTGKQAVAGLSEICEAFGGAGYIEDTGIPTLLRDAQVLPIWEGTTNVLSLDVLRVLNQIGSLQPWLLALRSLGAQITAPELDPVSRLIRETASRAGEWLGQHGGAKDAAAAGARGLAMTLARTLALALLARHADWTMRAESDPRPMAAARRFARLGINRLVDPAAVEARMLATDIYA